MTLTQVLKNLAYIFIAGIALYGILLVVLNKRNKNETNG